MNDMKLFFLLLFCICRSVVSATEHFPNSNELFNSSEQHLLTTNNLGVSANFYYAMDDLSLCTSSTTGSIIYFRNYAQSAYVRAWRSSSYKNPVANGCILAFNAYSYYALMLRFSRGSFMNDCSTSLKIYAGYGTNGPLLAHYTCNTYMPTNYIYTHESYLTLQLLNPNHATDFDFQINIENYHDLSNLSGWDIFGIVFGFVVFILLIIAMCACMRTRRVRRRRMATASATLGPRTTLIVSSPPSIYTSTPPYAASYGAIPNSNLPAGPVEPVKPPAYEATETKISAPSNPSSSSSSDSDSSR